VIAVLDVDQTLEAARELAAVYLSAFGAPGYDEDPARAEAFAKEQLPLHSQRDGFKFVAARSDDDRIVGFAYGFTGQRGQWWSDRIAETAPPRLYRRKGWQVLVPDLGWGSALYGLRLG